MNSKVIRGVFTALFAAIIGAGCLIAIPLPGGVPITVQNLFCILAGSILGSFYGFSSVVIWMILGAAGIPLFANAHGGLGILFGPTGGYIWGYALGALFTGMTLGSPKITENTKSLKFAVKLALLSFTGYALVYLPGIPWFMHVMAAKGSPKSFSDALKLTFIPFIPGDLIKWLITIPLTIFLRPIAGRYLFLQNQNEEKEALNQLKNGEKSE